MPSSLQRLSLCFALSLFCLAPAHAGTTPYTGLIVDARGCRVRPAMAPYLLGESGTAFFPAIDKEHPFDLDFAIAEGLALYARSLEEAWQLKRLGGNPLVVKAARVEDGDSFVLEEEAAKKVLEADYSAKFLSKNAVAIVY